MRGHEGGEGSESRYLPSKTSCWVVILHSFPGDTVILLVCLTSSNAVLHIPTFYPSVFSLATNVHVVWPN